MVEPFGAGTGQSPTTLGILPLISTLRVQRNLLLSSSRAGTAYPPGQRRIDRAGFGSITRRTSSADPIPDVVDHGSALLVQEPWAIFSNQPGLRHQLRGSRGDDHPGAARALFLGPSAGAERAAAGVVAFAMLSLESTTMPPVGKSTLDPFL